MSFDEFANMMDDKQQAKRNDHYDVIEESSPTAAAAEFDEEPVRIGANAVEASDEFAIRNPPPCPPFDINS